MKTIILIAHFMFIGSVASAVSNSPQDSVRRTKCAFSLLRLVKDTQLNNVNFDFQLTYISIQKKVGASAYATEEAIGLGVSDILEQTRQADFNRRHSDSTEIRPNAGKGGQSQTPTTFDVLYRKALQTCGSAFSDVKTKYLDNGSTPARGSVESQSETRNFTRFEKRQKT